MHHRPKSDTTDESLVQEVFDLHGIYTLFHAELERRHITEGVLEYDDSVDEEASHQSFSYTYQQSEGFALDVLIYADNYSVINIAIGPVQIDTFFLDSEEESVATITQFVDILQMCLNGQIAIVLTTRDEDQSWQAAELVWTTTKGEQKTIAVAPHYTHGRSTLSAATLRNNLSYPPVVLDKGHFLQPAKVNGHELLGRDIDLKKPVPLTPKIYAAYDKDMLVRHLGGDSGEAIWEVFYRRLEFWLVSIVIGTPALWIIIITPHSMWWVVPLAGLIGMGSIMAITSMLLNRRQALVDSGKIPLMERLEGYINYRVMSAFWALLLIATLFLAPIWTTEQNRHVLTTAFQNPTLIPPLAISCLGIFAAMLLVAPSSRRNKFLRTALMIASYSGVLYCNYVLLYGGDDAAIPPALDVLIITTLPLATIFYYLCDCFRRPHK